MRAEVTKITPALAKDWILNNVRNRHLREDLVRHYAGAIRRGEWTENGEAIKFDPDDNLLDGQHRLMAVCLAGIPITSLVIWGVPATAQDTLDIGAKRTLADVLELRKEPHPITLAAALSLLWQLEGDHVDFSGKRQIRPSNQQALTLLAKHPNLRGSLKVGEAVRRRTPLHPSIAAALHYQFSQIDETDAKDFFEKLQSGAHLNEDDPVLVLRQTLMRLQQREVRYSRIRLTALVIKAWNRYRDGEPLKQLKWGGGAGGTEAFPKAR